jgi:hypothetical protein
MNRLPDVGPLVTRDYETVRSNRATITILP